MMELQRARRGGVARACALFSALLLASSQLPAQAQDDATALERRVKAAFIFKFPGYVEWPAGTFARADAPVNIAVVGDDEIAAELAALAAGRTVDGRPLVIKKASGAQSLADANVVFVGRAELARLPQVAKLVQARPVLIVTDAPGALNHASMINFVLVQQRVKFEIAVDEAEKRGLKLSSRLLSVAQSVRKAAAP
ncbi:MAG: YfiR family protein [Burkholderiales bacterium]